MPAVVGKVLELGVAATTASGNGWGRGGCCGGASLSSFGGANKKHLVFSGPLQGPGP